MCQRIFTYQYYVKNYEIINLNNKNNADNISTICAISRFLIISLQYLYPLENIDFTLFFAIYLLIYSIFTPILSQYFQFGYFFFFLFFFCQFNLYYIYFCYIVVDCTIDVVIINWRTVRTGKYQVF